MAWNEPGGDDKDPWSDKGKDQGPPDLDEVVKNLQKKMGGLFGGKGGGRTPGGKGAAGSGKLVIALVIIVILVLLGIKGFYIVQPAERAVVQRLGAFHSVTTPGPHFLIPLIDTKTIINVDQVNKFGHRAQMLTKDENIVDVTLTVQFRIQDAANFLFQDADPVKTIYSAVESALREVTGKSTLDEIITQNRSAVAAMVKQNTQELLNTYKTGLVVTNVNIQDANPPEEVKEAFDDATRAMADKERVQNQADAYANDIVPRARGAAARQVEDAKAYAFKVVSEAQGETKRFLALLGEYQKAPEVTRERLYLDTMQQVLADTGKVLLDVKEGSNTLTYLPLDKLVQPGSTRTPVPAAQLPGYESLEAESASRKLKDARDRRQEVQRDRERARRNR
ncbi:FtsH protease activity modulator HflK [Thiolapillus brandeum]|uniref:Protein HflK n=1 Tax=Thiolapillus brandeum TaxID=1076588 RepID=A0A7U6JI66_9GAMM|nr:FtsH protease activity modulator HflK [Thiolapillus brandeum]BAO45006.1 membrane protease subunit HflK [Thiolapillus brandeum]